MKKIKLITLMVGFFALFILGNINQPVVHADVKYEINNVNVVATVNENGSLSIKRTIYYKFNSLANGGLLSTEFEF